MDYPFGPCADGRPWEYLLREHGSQNIAVGVVHVVPKAMSQVVGNVRRLTAMKPAGWLTHVPSDRPLSRTHASGTMSTPPTAFWANLRRE